MRHAVILLHPEAPAKPAEGGACTGCGVCCTAAPCPVGQILSRRRAGACVALRWADRERRYRCGVVDEPRRFLPWLPQRAGRWLALRWIAAAQGCDSDYEVS